MRIVPLGTSSGQATMDRSVTSLAAFVGSEKEWVMIDCGEGARMQAMRAKLSLPDLKALLITHAHGDHCFGVFTMLSTLSVIGRTKPLRVVCPKEVRQMIEMVQKTIRETPSYAIEWSEPEHGLDIDLGDGLKCRCIEMSHRAPSHGYLLSSARSRVTADADAFKAAGFEPGPLLGQAIASAKRGQPSWREDGSSVDMSDAVKSERVTESLFVGGDNAEPMRVAKAAAGATAWIHEATYVQTDWEHGGAGEKWGHSSAKMIGEAAAAGRPGSLVLTHFSPRYGEGPLGVERLADEARSKFDGPVHIATDLQPLDFAPMVEPERIKKPKPSI